MSSPQPKHSNPADCAGIKITATQADLRPQQQVERRRSPRQTLVAKATLHPEGHDAAVATSFMSNVSALGVGFHTRRALPVGARYQMRVELGPVKWAARLRVVSCQMHGDGTWDVGAEFLQEDCSTIEPPAQAA